MFESENARELESRLARQSQTLEDLTGIVWSLTSGRSLDQILSALMGAAVRTLHAEVGGIFHLSGNHIEGRVQWGLDASVVSRLETQGRNAVARAYDLCRPVRPDHSGDIRAISVEGLHVSDWLAIPVAVKGEIFGVMVLVNPHHGARFSDDDVEAAQLLCGLAAVAIKNARLLAEEQKQAQLQQQLRLARSVQMALLPDPALSLAGLQWQALYVPAFEIGGDYYDVVPLSEHEALLVIGDVSSKGVPAALLMTAVRAMVRAEANRIPHTAQLVGTINRAVCSDFARDHEMFVTLFCGRVNTRTRQLVYTNAGHPPPLVWGPGTEQPEPLREGGSILGQLAEAEFSQGAVTLAPGWRFWAFTDGVTEARSARGELFGTPGVMRFAATHSSTAGDRFQSELKITLGRFASEPSDVDDVTSLWVSDATRKILPVSAAVKQSRAHASS